MKPITKSHRVAQSAVTLVLLCAILLISNSASALDTQPHKWSGAERDLRVQIAIPDTADVQRITTRKGTAFQGRTLSVGEDEIEFQTSFGTVKIPISEIVSCLQVPKTQLRNGSFWFTNPNATRLFFAPTARMLKQGQGYVASYYLFFPSVALGLTDRLTIGGGLSLFPGEDMDNQIYFLTPKVGIVAQESFHFAAGALVARVPENDPVGILYGVTTFGSTDNSITMGLGYGFDGGNLAEKPMIVVGFEKRLTARTAFVSENWIFPGVENPLLTFGFRLFGDRLSVDVGLVNTIGEHSFFPGIPYIDMVFQF